MMSTRRSVFAFGVLLAAIVLLVPGVGLAQTDVPAQVASPQVSEIDGRHDAMRVRWTAVTTDSNGEALHAEEAITGYRIYYHTADITSDTLAAAAQTKDVGKSDVTSVVDGLTAGTRYYVVVAARNKNGLGARSSSDNVTIPALPDLTAPKNVTLKTEKSGEIEVSWDAVETADSYKVAWSMQGAGGISSSVTVKELKYTITGLTNGTKYDVTVSAMRTTGSTTTEGPASDKKTAEPTAGAGDTTTLGAPQRITVESNYCCGEVGVRHIRVSWDSVAGATGYTVEWRTQGQTSGTASTSAEVTDGTVYEIARPDYATVYLVKVRATNTDGDGSWSNEAQVRVDERIQEQAVVTATPGNEKFTVSWTAVSHATWYCVRWRPIEDRPHAGDGECHRGKVASLRELVVDYYYDHETDTRHDIKNGTEYVVDVQGYNNTGWGPKSKVVKVTPMGKPEDPPVMEVTGGDTMITVSWEVHPAATEYEIQWRSEGQSFGATARTAKVEVGDDASMMNGDTPMMSYDITELTNGMTYEVRVRAKNAHGAGPWSQGEAMAGTQPVPALPLFGALVLGAGLMTAGRRRLRARQRRLLKA